MSTETPRIAVDTALPQPPVQVAPVPVEQPSAPPLGFRTLEPLRQRQFTLFWGGALTSNIGTWMQNVALSWLVLTLTNSAFWVAMVSFSQFIPTLLFGLFGGLLADRADRRLVLLVTQTVAMGLALGLTVVTWTGHASVSTVLPIIGITGIVMAFNAPSFQAIIPDLVPRRLIPDAVSLNSAQFSMARVFGPAIAGAIMWAAVAPRVSAAASARTGAGWVFLINGLSYLAVIGALLVVRTERQVRPTSSGARALFGGVRHARGTPAVATLLATTAVVSLFGAPVIVLLPVMARDVLGMGPGGYGGLFAIFSVGAVGGAILMSTIVRRFGMRLTTSVSLAMLAALEVGFGTSRNLVLSSALLIGIGAVYTMTVSATNSGLQTSVPASKRGRVMSLYMMAWGGLYPVGALSAGFVATHFHLGAPRTLYLMAVPLTAGALALAALGRARPEAA